MSERSKNVPQEFLTSPWPPLHLLCILRNIVGLVKSAAEGWQRKEEQELGKEPGEWWVGALKKERGRSL